MTPGRTGDVAELLARGGYHKVSRVLEGGETRSASAQRALGALGAEECDVLLHDAARPLVSQQIIEGCVTALKAYQAVGVTVPSSDTIVVTTDGVITQMPSRDSLHRCQTPQGFRLSVIRRAYELAGADPGVRGDRRLRCRPAVSARRADRGGGGQRTQHKDHLPG